jgi:hypothetical protein
MGTFLMRIGKYAQSLKFHSLYEFHHFLKLLLPADQQEKVLLGNSQITKIIKAGPIFSITESISNDGLIDIIQKFSFSLSIYTS